MARALKPMMVDTVTDRESNEKIEIFYDRNSGKNVHFAQCGGSDRFEDPDIRVVERWARERLQEVRNFDWKPVIEATLAPAARDNDQEKQTKVDFSAERYFIALRPDGNWIRAHWGDDGKPHPYHRSEFHRTKVEFGVPIKRYVGDQTITVLIEYTEAQWLSFQQIREALNQIRSQLEFFIATTDGQSLMRRLVERAAQHLLAPPGA